MKDQCVCITGSTHGIGFGIAEAFAKKGAKIVINSHENDNGALDKLNKLTECYFVQSDLSTIDGNKKLIQEAKVKLGKIDTLINNAGTFQDTDFENINAKDYEEFKIGNITIVAIHTPGHTIESTTYLLRDSFGKDHAIFTGDTLFLGDVGRPDLSQKSSLSNSDLASMLFDSLRNKIMTLNDDVIIYPGHGEGSSCGKDLSSDTIGTLGDQKKTN